MKEINKPKVYPFENFFFSFFSFLKANFSIDNIDTEVYDIDNHTDTTPLRKIDTDNFDKDYFKCEEMKAKTSFFFLKFLARLFFLIIPQNE